MRQPTKETSWTLAATRVPNWEDPQSAPSEAAGLEEVFDTDGMTMCVNIQHCLASLTLCFHDMQIQAFPDGPVLQSITNADSPAWILLEEHFRWSLSYFCNQGAAHLSPVVAG